MSEWQTVSGGGGTFVKFEQDGQVVEGVLTGMRQGEFGTLYQFQRVDGSLVSIGDSYALKENLPNLVGKVVRVTYNGKKPTKSGKTVKDFTIQVSSQDADNYMAAVARDDDDSNLPF